MNVRSRSEISNLWGDRRNDYVLQGVSLWEITHLSWLSTNFPSCVLYYYWLNFLRIAKWRSHIMFRFVPLVSAIACPKQYDSPVVKVFAFYLVDHTRGQLFRLSFHYLSLNRLTPLPCSFKSIINI